MSASSIWQLRDSSLLGNQESVDHSHLKEGLASRKTTRVEIHLLVRRDSLGGEELLVQTTEDSFQPINVWIEYCRGDKHAFQVEVASAMHQVGVSSELSRGRRPCITGTFWLDASCWGMLEITMNDCPASQIFDNGCWVWNNIGDWVHEASLKAVAWEDFCAHIHDFD